MTNLDLTNQQMSAQMVHSIHNFHKIIVINLNELVHCLCLMNNSSKCCTRKFNRKLFKKCQKHKLFRVVASPNTETERKALALQHFIVQTFVVASYGLKQ